MIAGKTFDHRPIKELIAMVRNDFRTYDEEGLIDAGTLIKAIMYCNDRLGIPVREIKQKCIEVSDFKGELPLNFERLYFVCALTATNTNVHRLSPPRNPFDNSFDHDILYEVDIDRGSFGCAAENVSIVIKRESNIHTHHCSTWIPLSLGQSSFTVCHESCPNLRKPGRYQIDIIGDKIETPFKSGQLYMMYLGTMEDEEGNLLFPFHPMITPYYEWVLKEKILMDVLMNSDANFEETQKKLQHAQIERTKAWVDAWNITLERSFGEYVAAERKKELGYYTQYFRYLQ